MALFYFVSAIAIYNLVKVDNFHWHEWTWKQIVTIIPRDKWNYYLHEITKNPIRAKAMTSGTVYVIGDIIS